MEGILIERANDLKHMLHLDGHKDPGCSADVHFSCRQTSRSLLVSSIDPAADLNMLISSRQVNHGADGGLIMSDKTLGSTAQTCSACCRGSKPLQVVYPVVLTNTLNLLLMYCLITSAETTLRQPLSFSSISSLLTPKFDEAK